MQDYLRRSWAVVDLGCLEHNVAAIRERLSTRCMIMGVVKADAYGHGDKYVSDQLVRMGVEWLGVSNLEEALSLREQGIFHPILIFGITPPEYASMLTEYNLTQTIHSLDYAEQLNAVAHGAGVTVQCHIKTDTGMSRLGFVFTNGYEKQSVEEILKACALPCLRIPGIYTHFSVADDLSEESIFYTKGQFELFRQAVERLEIRGVYFTLRHCCNSAGIINYPEMHLDMVRPGILLYGLEPSEECRDRLDLQPVMQLYSAISMVKEIDRGTSVSYGRRYTSHRRMKIATVPIGYADGFGRELSNKARMLVRGRFVSVIGRVCMDQLMLDVTHVEGVREGDLVTIVGCDGENSLTFDEMANMSGTINYEKTCLIGKRVPRVYRYHGKDIGVVDYIRRKR